MKTGKKKSAGKTAAKAQAKAGKHARNAAKTAIDLLKEDHAAVQAIFKEYRQLVQAGGDTRRKYELVRQACDMLIIHARIEEEVFYPAVRRALSEKELMDEALVEHDCAKDLLEQLRVMRPNEPFYDAKFIVMGELVRHHIREEEGKMFPKAKKAGLDLVRLGEELEGFKRELEEDRSTFYGEFLDKPTENPVGRQEMLSQVQQGAWRH
jgi:hemerythrin superfamily protein